MILQDTGFAVSRSVQRLRCLRSAASIEKQPDQHAASGANGDSQAEIPHRRVDRNPPPNPIEIPIPID